MRNLWTTSFLLLLGGCAYGGPAWVSAESHHRGDFIIKEKAGPKGTTDIMIFPDQMVLLNSLDYLQARRLAEDEFMAERCGSHGSEVIARKDKYPSTIRFRCQQ